VFETFSRAFRIINQSLVRNFSIREAEGKIGPFDVGKNQVVLSLSSGQLIALSRN